MTPLSGCLSLNEEKGQTKYLPIIYLIANLLPNDDVNPKEHSVQAMPTVLAGPLPRDDAGGCPGDPPAQPRERPSTPYLTFPEVPSRQVELPAAPRRLQEALGN